MSGSDRTVFISKKVVLDILLFMISILMIGLFNYDYVMLVMLLAIYPYLKLTARLHLFIPFGIAVIQSSIWGYVAVEQYEYSLDGLKIGILNLYPVFFWTFGLFIVKLVYSGIAHLFRDRNPLLKMLVFSSMFWTGLITVEFVVYHFFNIRNLATRGNPGLPFIDALHAPVWMQVAYFMMGPVYFILTGLAERTAGSLGKSGVILCHPKEQDPRTGPHDRKDHIQ